MTEGFREGFVEADGFRIRYMDAGQGPALVHLHGAGVLDLSLDPPGSGDVDALMSAIELFGKKVLPRIHDI